MVEKLDSLVRAEEEKKIPLREWLYHSDNLDPYSLLQPYFRMTPQDAAIAAYTIQDFHKQRIPGKDSLGLVVGRFQPPHAGHFYMIDAALQVADTVVIGIGTPNRDLYMGKDQTKYEKTWEDNPFSALQRHMILKQALKEKGIDQERIKFVYLKDYGNERWSNETLEQLSQWGKPDLVLRDSSWVNKYFKDTEIRAVRPRPIARELYSGTFIRAKLRESGALRPFGVGK